MSLIMSLVFINIIVIIQILYQDFITVVFSVIGIGVFERHNWRFIKTIACGFYHPWVFLLAVVQRGICQTSFRFIGLKGFHPGWFMKVFLSWRSVQKVSLHRVWNISFESLRYLWLDFWWRFSELVDVWFLLNSRMRLCSLNVRVLILLHLIRSFIFYILFSCLSALIWWCYFMRLGFFLIFYHFLSSDQSESSLDWQIERFT